MALQSVLFPQGSLMIVDKGMRKKVGNAIYESQPFSVSDRDIKVSVLGPASNASEPKLQQPESVSGGGTYQRFRFVDNSKGRKRPRNQRKRPAKVKQERRVAQGVSSKESSPSDNSSLAQSTNISTPASNPAQLLHPVPGSSSPLYGRHDNASPLVSDILPFYHDMTHFFYPMQAYLPLEFDPVTTIYLPASLRDVCMLYAIVTSAASRLQGMHGWQIDHSTVFFQGASQEMRRRISSGDITDSVLMAVTCFVLRDYCRGNIDESETHVNGMLRMLDVRGGIGTVHPGFRQKIYRALLNPAIDYLSKVRWPRLERNTPSLHSTLLPDQGYDSSVALLLSQAELDSPQYEIMTRLHNLSDAINHAIEHKIPIHPFSLDQDILTIQHDLLSLDDGLSTDLNNTFRLAGLIFTKLLTREPPLPILNSETVPTAITRSIGKLAAVPKDTILRFWCLFMGALAAKQPNNQKRLVSDLKRSCLSLRISAWEAAQAHLRQIAWITPAFDAAGFDLWQQLGIEPQ